MLFSKQSKGIDWEAILSDFDALDTKKNGIFIETDTRDIVYFNSRFQRIFNIQSGSSHRLFGNLAKCQNVYGTDSLCGTRRHCNNCRLKNSIETIPILNGNEWAFQFNQKYVISGVPMQKWFDANAQRIRVNHQTYLIIELKEQTQAIRNKINQELRVLEEAIRN